MRHCPDCQSPLSFRDLLIAINPAKIICGKCHRAIRVDTRSAIAMATLAVVLALTLVWGLTHFGHIAFRQSLYAIILLGLALELIYYLLLKSGIIASELITASPITGDSTTTSNPKSCDTAPTTTNKACKPTSESPKND